MSFYINTDRDHEKTEWLVEKAQGRIVGFMEAKRAVKDPSLGVVVVVDNIAFEAAAFAYDEEELTRFLCPDDDRDKRCVVMPRELAEKMSGYDKVKGKRI